MKKLLLAALLSIGSLAIHAQTQFLGTPTTTVETRGKHVFDSAARPPLDTLASAPIGSIAVKNGIHYTKILSGKWVVNPSPDMLGFIPTPQYNGLTYWYDHFWASSTDNNYSALGGLTASLNGNFIELRGSGNTVTETYSKNVLSYVEHWIKYDTIKIDTTISSTTFGISNGIGSSVTANFGKLDLTNTGTGGNAYIVIGTTIQQTSGTKLVFAQGDVLASTFQQMRDTLIYTVTDLTTPSTVTVQYIVSNAFSTVGTQLIHGGNNYFTGVMGGTYTLQSSRVVNLDNLNPPLAIIGDSKAQGYYNGVWNNRISDLLNINFAPCANFGSSGITINQQIAQINDVFLTRPSQVLVFVGCNDVRQNRTAAQAINDMQNLVGQLAAHNIRYYILSSPETGGNAVANRQYDSSLRQTFPIEYINIYDTIASNTASFISSDGIHLTATGAAAAYTKIVQSGKVVATSYAPSFTTGNPDAATLGQVNTFRNPMIINTNANGNGGATSLTLNDSSGTGQGGGAILINAKYNTAAVVATIQSIVTNTASGANSSHVNFFTNGIGSVFNVDFSGNVFMASGSKLQTNGPTQKFSNNTTSFTHSTASLFGTNDDFVSPVPGASGYGVLEGGGLGTVISCLNSTTPIKFAPGRVVKGQFFGSGNFAVGTTSDNNGFVQTGANTTTIASLFLNGAAADVTSPTNGMVWYNSTAHTLNFRDNGVTNNLLLTTGTSTQSGNSSTTAFTIAHSQTGISSTSTVLVTPRSSAAAGNFFVTTDATNITITYLVAPGTGTNNLTWTYSIKP